MWLSHPVPASSPERLGWAFLSQVASNTPSLHTTSALHLTHPQASGRGQDTRDSPLAQHKPQCPRPPPHPAICTAILHLLSTLPDVLICVNIYFCV